MGSLLRKLSDKDAWAEIEGSVLWNRQDCPPAALRQVFDNRSGVSTWRVNTPDDIERVIAAQTFIRSTIQDFSYCLIDEDVLQNNSIRTKDIPAKTFDKYVNSLHVDLIELTGQQVITLAHLINSTFEPKVMTRSEILKCAAKYFLDGTFDRDFLFMRNRGDADVATSKDLLVNLWKKKEIEIRI